MTRQEAVEAPHRWIQGQTLEMEPGCTLGVRHGPTVRGYDVEIVPKRTAGMTVICFAHANGLLHDAACWREDGARPVCTVGQPG